MSLRIMFIALKSLARKKFEKFSKTTYEDYFKRCLQRKIINFSVEKHPVLVHVTPASH